jgi:uroporphyrin-III C-methyltransferase
VYLVGAGPGDPGLLTRKALRLLEDAEVVIHDRLVSSEILSLANPRAILVDGGKRFGEQERIQAEIHRAFLRHRDRVLVRLKAGDPMVFGRGGEELAFLSEHGFEVEVVPGVSSAVAAPALAGIPLTYRGVAASFAVIAGHRQSVCSVDWTAYRGIDTLVVLMGVELRDVIAGSLIGAGRPASQPVAFVTEASTRRERYVESTLGAVARGRVEVEAPSVMLIGEVVRLRTPWRAPALEEAAA